MNTNALLNLIIVTEIKIVSWEIGEKLLNSLYKSKRH